MSLEFIRFNLSIIKFDRYGNGTVIHKYILTSILLLSIIAIWVVEFSNGGCKIRKVSTQAKEIIQF